MSVPLHWNADGLPIGVQFAAPFGGEGRLLGLAAQLGIPAIVQAVGILDVPFGTTVALDGEEMRGAGTAHHEQRQSGRSGQRDDYRSPVPAILAGIARAPSKQRTRQADDRRDEGENGGGQRRRPD